MLDDNLPGRRRITVGGDKGYDTSDFVADCRERNVTPHVAQNITKRRRSAIDERTTGTPATPSASASASASRRSSAGPRPSATSAGLASAASGPTNSPPTSSAPLTTCYASPSWRQRRSRGSPPASGTAGRPGTLPTNRASSDPRVSACRFPDVDSAAALPDGVPVVAMRYESFRDAARRLGTNQVRAAIFTPTGVHLQRIESIPLARGGST